MFRLFLSCCWLAAVWLCVVQGDRDGRIIGGTTARAGQFPYQVSLRTLSNLHFCGATYFTDSWLLTACHCTIKRKPYGFAAHIGALSKSYDGTKYDIMRVVNHPDYVALTMRNDIALIRTDRPITRSATVMPIRLGGASVLPGRIAMVSGWGYTSNPGATADYLQWVQVETMSVDECRTKMNPVNVAKLFDTTICTVSVKNERTGACKFI